MTGYGQTSFNFTGEANNNTTKYTKLLHKGIKSV